jgi:hypothetical protein
MNKEFVIRGKTASGFTEVLNFSGNTPGYAYRLTEFSLWGTAGLGSATTECWGTITAGKVAVDPVNPDFSNEGLIAVASSLFSATYNNQPVAQVINDTFLITQNIILMVQDSGPAGTPVNWQCRFVAQKMDGSEEAVANFKQFTIFDG